MKLNTSPNVTPSLRRRRERSDPAFSAKTYPARTPPRFAGESRNIRLLWRDEESKSLCSSNNVLYHASQHSKVF